MGGALIDDDESQRRDVPQGIASTYSGLQLNPPQYPARAAGFRLQKNQPDQRNPASPSITAIVVLRSESMPSEILQVQLHTRRFAFSFQFSVFSCQLSVVGCQLSVVGCQLSVVSCQLSET
jgi:hypothetical protein